MTEIIPSILATSKEELKEQLDKLSWAKKIHIDIIDEKFAPNKTISIEELKNIKLNAEIQFHLMVAKPEEYIKACKSVGGKEIIFHSESASDCKKLTEDINKNSMKAGIAFNPPSNPHHHEKALKQASIALVMTVHPGFSGQKFIPEALHKISEILEINKNIKIGVDGGINKDTCQQACKAGASFLVAGSAILNSPAPEETYTEITKNCNK